MNKSKEAEDEKNWPEGKVHIVWDNADNFVKPFTVFIEGHDASSEQKANESRVDGVTSKD